MRFEAVYKSPDDETGCFSPAHLIHGLQQQNDAYDNLDLEQNILNNELKTVTNNIEKFTHNLNTG